MADGKMHNSFQNNTWLVDYIGKQRNLAKKKKKVYIRKCNHVNTLYKTGTI